MKREYEAVIGLEVHVELATKTKIFCGCSTEFGGEPNTHTCPVCSGMPGALPVLNKKAVEYAIAVGLAVGCEINKYSQFDRKNYFYPDNPQNYQITQFYIPICENGHIDIETADGKKQVRIREIHLEEDAGKLVHEKGADCSYIDFNRSGVPLIEIVSQPDMGNAEEVISYLEQLRMIARYVGASDCKLQEGSMRVDVNLSVRKTGSDILGTRTEMKNLNSFKAIARAIESETARQIDLIEAGKTVERETRRWDDAALVSYPMRSKEDAKDYRYFPDPDLPPIDLSDDFIRAIKEALPELRDAKKARYVERFGLPEYDAEIITASKRTADIFEETVAYGADPKKVSNWLMGETLRIVKEKGEDPEDIRYSAKNLNTLIRLVDDGSINLTVAKEVFAKIYESDVDPLNFVEEHGLKTVNDAGELQRAAKKVMEKNKKAVDEYRGGKTKTMGFLIGQLMKETAGKADPKLAKEALMGLLK